MRRVLASLFVGALVSTSTIARAEDGDTGSTNRLNYTTEPLRLMLVRDKFQFGSRMPGCEGTGAAPTDLWLTKELAPHLHFLGMIRSGCGMETGGGGGVAYTIEVKRDFYIVPSIGAWLTPPIHGVRDERVDPVFRLDLVWVKSGGRSFNLGLFASNTAIGVGFGFVW